MGHERFSYNVHKRGVVRIFWDGRCVMSLGGDRGRALAGALAEAGDEDEEVQRLLQRTTGNFRRGNERQKKVL